MLRNSLIDYTVKQIERRDFMKTMSAMAIYKMKTIEVMKNVKTDHADYPVADAFIKFIDNGTKVGVIAYEDGCVMVCDDFGCPPGSVNAYWFDEDEELEIGLSNAAYDPTSEYLDEDVIDEILKGTESMLDYLASKIG